MARSEKIDTGRLALVPFDRAHITARYLGWLNDGTLMRYSEQRHREHTRESAGEYLRSFAGTPNYFWAIIEQREGLGHIGNINAHVNERHLVADMGIMIGERKARKRQYALEAWQAVCGFLFSAAGMRKVTAGAMAANKPMVTLMRRAGMVEDGVRRRHYICDGQEMDIVHMALFADAGRTKHMNGESL